MPVQQLELLRGQRSAVVGVLAVAITARVECKVTGDNDHANRRVSDTMVRSASYNARAAWWWTSTSCSSAFLAVAALLQSDVHGLGHLALLRAAPVPAGSMPASSAGSRVMALLPFSRT